MALLWVHTSIKVICARHEMQIALLWLCQPGNDLLLPLRSIKGCGGPERARTGCRAPMTPPRQSTVVSPAAPALPACPGRGHRALTAAVRGVWAPTGRSNCPHQGHMGQRCVTAAVQKELAVVECPVHYTA